MAGTSIVKLERLAEKFTQQVRFVERSCQLFDQGVEDEAIRLATSLRTIFHQTGASTSLVTHLKLESMEMLSSTRGLNDHRDYIRWVQNLNSPTPLITQALLGGQFVPVSIPHWWGTEPVFEHNTSRYSRKRIILIAANKDGGAHVDENLDSFYEALSANGGGVILDGSKLVYSGGPPPFDLSQPQTAKNAHLSLIRQFGHEFLTSVSHFDWANAIRSKVVAARRRKG